MKKFKLFTGLFAMAVVLTGCATVGDVLDKNGKAAYYNDIVYSQGQVVKVEDYLYYGNGYFDSSASGFNYGQSAENGYLARLNVKDELKFNSSVTDEYKTSTSPKGILKVNDKLVGYQNQYMFALGSYLYFTSVNTHKTSSLENDYSRVSLFRVKFNGDKFEEFGTYKHDANSVITAQKGSDGKYYMIISEPADNSVYNLYSIKIGDELGKAKQLNKYTEGQKEVVDQVQRVAVCDAESTLKNVVYTVKSLSSGLETTEVKSVDFATGEITSLDSGVASSTTKLLGRSADVVFYSYQYKAVNEIYFKDLSTGDKYFNPTSLNKFYNASEIKNIKAVGDGYVFTAGSSGSLMYKTPDVTTDAVLLLTSDKFSDVLFVENGYVYLSNSTSIFRINVIDKSQETLVTMNAITSGKCGYDGEYIYFYAQLQEKAEGVTDENYYMYRVDKLGHYQLIGQTK